MIEQQQQQRSPSRRRRRRRPELVLLAALLLAGSSTAAPTAADRVLLTEHVDLIVSHGRSTEQRLFGSFSPTGLNYEVEGDVVQVSIASE